MAVQGVQAIYAACAYRRSSIASGNPWLQEVVRFYEEIETTPAVAPSFGAADIARILVPE
jgi:hypothetical protein